MNDRANWDMKFLGKVRSDGNISLVNEGKNIRFYIDIISQPPENLPEDALKYLTSFSADLENWGFIDDISLNEEERRKLLLEFLEPHFIMFKIKFKRTEEERSYYNAYDLELIIKQSGDDNRFYSVPFIKTFKGNTEDTLEKLFNNEYIQGNISISKEVDDYPSFLLVGEYEHMSTEKSNLNKVADKLYVFGPVKKIDYSERFGYKFITATEQTYYKEIEKSDLGEYYYSKDRVMFITEKIDNNILDSIKINGITMKINDVKQKIEDISENEFLDCFKEVALSRNLSYKASDLINFHTAMKTQGFVILAGLSGTGKSQIVQCYHESLNKFANKPNRNYPNVKSKLLFVPVRPFWQDDSDLLGYLDSSQGIYRPGDSGLVDFIKESNDNPDECYIVCLDEMNLAKVEHYFSQFLSVLEREAKDRVIHLYNEKLNGRVYNQNDYHPTLTLGENLLFVGTVNLDESTFQFSDKVLDRANVITLDLSPFEDIRKSIENYKAKIIEEKQNKDEDKQKKDSNEGETVVEALQTYNKMKSMKKSSNNDVLSAEEVEILWNINLEMQNANKQIGVGYRIIVQIENYIANLPNTDFLDRRVAFDLQITQRIFTKLRGSQGQLGNLIGKFVGGEYDQGSLYKLLTESELISDFTLAKNKLKILAKELEEYGHTI